MCYNVFVMQEVKKPLYYRIIFAPGNLMRKLYDWTIKFSDKKSAKKALFAISFAESSFFPIPPDVLLIAMTVANRYKWWIFALISSIGSVLGAVAAYFIGLFFFEAIGRPIINFYGMQTAFETVGTKYNENAFLAIFGAAFTPIPFKVFTIAGGAFQISLLHFILASALGRSARFFAVAGTLRIFGKQIADVIEKYFNIISIIFLALLIAGYIAVKYFLH